jgi:hypothetical protein
VWLVFIVLIVTEIQGREEEHEEEKGDGNLLWVMDSQLLNAKKVVTARDIGWDGVRVSFCVNV